MSDWKDRLIYPPLYLFFLLAAVFAVYLAFTVGFERGEYVGKYDPHEQGAVAPSDEEESYDLAAMLAPSDELVGMGEELFSINCVSCHGAGGRGDGPKAAGLNPPPRNFASGEQFKQGGGTLQIYQTLNTGVPGSSMASFSYLNPQELMALSHYVRIFIASPAPDPVELVSRLAPASSAGAVSQPTADTSSSVQADSMAGEQPQAEPGRIIPLEFAVERILAEQKTGAVPLDNPPSVYRERCAVCHGKFGEGAIVERKFPQTGSIYTNTRPIAEVPSYIISDTQSLADFLAGGLRGQPGHRFPSLTAREVRDILESFSRASGSVLR